MDENMPFVQVTKVFKKTRMPAMVVTRSVYESEYHASLAFFTTAGMEYTYGESRAPSIDFFDEEAFYEEGLVQLEIALYNENEVRLASVGRSFPRNF